MRPQPIIRTGKLVLRPFELSDSKRVQELAGDPKISGTAINVPYPYKDGMAEEWINTHKQDFENDKSINYAILKKGTDELIGSISLIIDRINSKAEIGYWVGVPYWGKGYCTEAARAIIEIGFKDLNLNKIHGKAFTTNKGSCTILENMGMSYEGVLRQEIIHKGVLMDLKRYAILREDFNKGRNNFEYK